MSRSRWVVGWLASVSFLGGTQQLHADQFSQAEIQQLLTQLGSNADQALRDDLANPSLLPSDGYHRARLRWKVDPAIGPEGAILVGAPVAARVGDRLRTLRVQGVSFSDSFTVRRIFSALDSWNMRTDSDQWADAMADAAFRVRDTMAAQGVTNPDPTFIWNALAGRPALRDMFLVSETSRDFPAYDVLGDLRPSSSGTIECYDVYRYIPIGPDSWDCLEPAAWGCFFKRPCPGPGSPDLELRKKTKY